MKLFDIEVQICTQIPSESVSVDQSAICDTLRLRYCHDSASTNSGYLLTDWIVHTQLVDHGGPNIDLAPSDQDSVGFKCKLILYGLYDL